MNKLFNSIAEKKRKRRAAAVLDWNITYEWEVLLGKDKK